MRTLLALLALACVPAAQEKNVLVILADDLGVADLAAVGKAGYTPNLSALGAAGVVFDHAFVNPTCSPTRDGLLTGRWGGKLDGTPCLPLSGHEIPLDIPTLPGLVSKTHATGLFGKWHLGRDAKGELELEDIPGAYGYGFFCGTAANLIECDSSNYTDWQHCHAGSVSASDDYAPRVILDDLKAWWAGTKGEKLAVWAPWLSHGPMHRPPEEELPEGYPPTSTQREKYESEIATLDRHVGEMLAVVDPKTTLVLFLGDNGTPSNVAPLGFANKVKGSTYERGINVPCILAAPGVTPGLSSRMVSAVDIIPTVAQYLGMEKPTGLPGVSMGSAPNVRDWIISIDYAANLFPITSSACLRTGSGLKFMLVNWHSAAPDERFYDLSSDPTETTDLGPQSHKSTQNLMRTALYAALPK